jgi:RHS repeat-associated protein
MRITNSIRKTLVLLLLICLPATMLLAADESYIQTLTGKIKKGDSCVVIDDKFMNLPLAEWNQLRHLSVNNIVSFELRSDTSIYYHNKSFACTLNVSIKYYTSRDQQTPTEISNVSLVVRYDTTKGAFYPVDANYTFKNAFKVIVVINSISSPELGQNIPSIFRVKNQIFVKRKYPFNPNPAGTIGATRIRRAVPSSPLLLSNLFLTILTQVIDGQLVISWDPNEFSNPEEYDVEWTYIDRLSKNGVEIATLYNNGDDIPISKAIEWMKNNSTRVTLGTTTTSYTVNVPYHDGYVLVRIRGVSYTAERVRHEGQWQYDNGSGKAVCEEVDDHETDLNWQYVATFAEQGKRNEMITYFDGAMRNHQSVTLSNSNKTEVPNDPGEVQETAIVQETIHDEMGRPALSMMPAPTPSKSLKYYPAFNKTEGQQAYSHLDITLYDPNECHITAKALNPASGTYQYYSPANPFQDDDGFYFTRYVPNGGDRPFSLTEYVQDNTGRIRRQGGVGDLFQPGSKDTRYYYGKPGQQELDRLFGSEVGDKSHYLKNMVIDPSGQAIVTYIDANGRMIAAALAGPVPANLDALPSAEDAESSAQLNQRIIDKNDFRRDASTMQMQATTIFLAAIPNASYQLHYTVNPASVLTQHGQGQQFCSNCYYTILIEIKNACGETIETDETPAFNPNDVVCNPNPTVFSGTLPFQSGEPGEYTITYTLQLSEEVVNNHVDYYIDNNSDLYTLQHFFQEELDKLDLSGCYSECESCKTLGDTPDKFREKVIDLLSTDKFEGIDISDINSPTNPLNQWITETWNDLKAKCSLLNCQASSACEDFLMQMKFDVIPGGQYASYTYDETTEAYTYAERTINVMRFYNQNVAGNSEIYNFSFTGENGNTIFIRNLSESDFIKEYIDHPEWADMFVKKHIEYCSYLWCKDPSYSPLNKNNEESYTFDKTLRETVTDGADAIEKGYYDTQDMFALLDADPFFNGGRGTTWKDEMQQDMNNLSTVLGFVMQDASQNTLPAKNIFQFIDWMLYCRPQGENPTATELVNSWSTCPPPSQGCRTMTLQWELYRNYYLKLKGKYLQLVKGQVDPSCVNCFIGQDLFAAAACPPPGPFSDYTVVQNGTVPNEPAPLPVYSLVYKNGTEPFKGDYRVKILVHSGACGPEFLVDEEVVVTTRKGQLRLDNIFTCRCTAYHNPCAGTSFEILSIDCMSGQAPQAACTINPPCPSGSEFHYEEGEHTFTFSTGFSREVWPKYYVRDAGPVTRPVNIRILRQTLHYGEGGVEQEFEWKTLLPGQQSLFMGNEMIEWTDFNHNNIHEVGEVFTIDLLVFGPFDCPAVGAASSCTSDPNYLHYSGKIRIFNDNIDEQFYLDCAGDNPPTFSEAENLAKLRALAMEELEVMKGNWQDYLAAVNEEEQFGLESVIPDVVNGLYEVAKKWIQIAPKENIRPASTLPPGESSSLGHASFDAVFNAYITPTLIQQGFSADLLAKPYPYNRTPITANPNSADITPTIVNNLVILKARWQASSVPTFHAYLQQELGEDYGLTQEELTDLDLRCGTGCRYMEKPLTLPVAFVAAGAPTAPMFVECDDIAGLRAAFLLKYPGIIQTRKLYRVLYMNYLNHQLGFPLAYSEYALFEEKCDNDPNAVLYNKPEAPFIIPDDFLCAANLISRAYERAGQEYERYIVIERKKFRNRYISTCLGNGASATIEGEQREYHHTLYYYDQSGNLVKTIPPAGVRLLSLEEADQVDKFRQFDPASCVNITIPASENKTVTLTAVSDALQGGTGKSLELWLNNTGTSADRQIRFITPDNKYMYQAAIHDDKLWVELYTVSQEPGGVTEIALTNQAVADISSITLKSWSHLVVQSGDFAGAPWEVFLDGKPLGLLPPADAPPYPFAWEIAANEPLPAEELALLKHLRLYERIIQPAEVLSNYYNACLNPQDQLADPLIIWGRFNIPTLCTNTETLAVNNRGALQVTENLGWRSKMMEDVTNNFTVELWVNPQQPHEIDVESQAGAGGTSGQAWAIYPTNGGAPVSGRAGMGISVGTNGVSVYEHSDGYMPALLVWQGSITTWTHVAVVYTNRIPSLYIDGALVRTGLPSAKQHVMPCYNFGAGAFGFMPGGIDEARIWSMSRSQQQIADNRNQGVASSEAGLVGYWPISTADGTQLEDFSCNNRPYELTNPHTWLTNGAPVTDRVHVEYATNFLVPQHGLPTTYAYNSLNAAIKQTSPDAGTVQFFYDRLGRITASQTAEQLESMVGDYNNRFTYTKYDLLGRASEVGEKIDAGFMSEVVARDLSLLSAWLESGSNRQVTQSFYDVAPAGTPGVLTNLRKRIAATIHWDGAVGAAGKAASYFSYDIAGNIKTVYQENDQLVALDPNTGIKQIDYEYDLVSGNINKVKYQEGKGDQFYYDYRYDDDNRVVEARTSRDNLTWNLEGSYHYYLHGPVARVELGHNKVQGLDYAYTLQGWLKGVNGSRLDAATDMSNDGHTSPFNTTTRDAIAFSLGYYGNGEDYTPIGGSPANAFSLSYTPSAIPTGQDMFTGLISHGTLALRGIDNGTAKGYSYRYDQLGRLTKMRMHTIGAGNTWDNTSIIDAYQEDISYEANGNIISYLRRGNNPVNLNMDNLTYHYNRNDKGQLINNKLRHVTDNVNDNPDPYTDDISTQPDDNNSYDNTGNLIADQQEKITRIEWTLNGKIASIFKDETTPGPFGIPVGMQTIITYRYDANGHRISKSVTQATFSEAAPPPPTTTTTFYVRDASSNIVSVYTNHSGPPLENSDLIWSEQHLYGTNRLGVWYPNIPVTQTWQAPAGQYQFNIGERVYELSNHLGNVVTTISDNRTAINDDSDPEIDYYAPIIVSASDYYPFGMLMPGRHVGNYRFGFNGQEKSTEIGKNHYEAQYWEYDARIGKRWNIDPVPKTSISGYVVLGNSPITYVDPNGADWYKNSKGEIVHLRRKGKNIRGHEWLGSGPTLDYNGYTYDRHKRTQNLAEVYVTAKRKPRPIKWLMSSWPKYTKDDTERWISHQAILRDRHTNNEELMQEGDSREYKQNFPAYERQYQAKKEHTRLTLYALGIMAAPIAAFGLAESGAVYYTGHLLRTGFQYGVRTYGRDFTINTAKQFFSNNGDYTKIDWFDVGASTLNPFKKLGMWSGSATEGLNSLIDVKGGQLQVAFIHKSAQDVILDFGFGQIKAMGKASFNGIGGDNPSRDFFFDVGVGIFKNEAKRQVNNSINMNQYYRNLYR